MSKKFQNSQVSIRTQNYQQQQMTNPNSQRQNKGQKTVCNVFIILIFIINFAFSIYMYSYRSQSCTEPVAEQLPTHETIKKIIADRFQCQSIVQIDKNSEKLKHIQDWINNNHTEAEEAAQYRKAFQNCAIVDKQSMKPQFLLYKQFSYIVFEDGKDQILLKEIYKFIQSHQLNQDIRIYPQTIQDQSTPYIVLEFQNMQEKKQAAQTYKRMETIKRLSEQVREISNQNIAFKRHVDQLTNELSQKNQQIQCPKPEEQSINSKRTPKNRKRLSYTNRIGAMTPKGSFRRSFPEQPANIVFHPSFKMYLKSHAHYLQKNNVTTVLEINCNLQCMQKLDNLDKKFQVTYGSANFKQLQGKFDWIVIRQLSIEQKLVALANIAAENAQKGVTIFLRNIEELRKFNAMYRDFVFESMKYYGLEYDEAASLNLRRPEGKVLLIFNRNRIKSSFPFKKPIKNNIAMQEVLILGENIPYMRQWIGYHIYLGVDKFFIYDNNGSQGEPGMSTDQQNKYGFKFGCLNLTQEKIIQQWDSIWQQFYEHIIYIPWQQTLNGKIIYGQVESQADFMDFFQDTTSYVGFIDADQMLFSQKNLNFTNFLAWHSLHGNTGLSMMQKKYSNRYCLLNQKMIQINQTYFLTTSRGEAQKSFFEMDNFCPWGSIHDGTVYKGKKYFLPDVKNFGFNHYNLIGPFIQYYQARKRTTETRMSYDNSGRQRYGKIMQEICQGKCSESFKSVCDLTSIQCPKMDKEYIPNPNIRYNARGKWW